MPEVEAAKAASYRPITDDCNPKFSTTEDASYLQIGSTNIARLDLRSNELEVNKT